MKTLKFLFILFATISFLGCEKDSDTNKNVESGDTEYLKHIWIDKESYAIQFIDFYSDTQAQFGMYAKNFVRYDTFNYRLFEGEIAIKFLSDNPNQETVHTLTKPDEGTMEIRNLTAIPENPNKIYLKRNLITGKDNAVITIGHNQIYYDFSHDFRIQIDSVLNDSRCPIDANCVWEGNAEIRFDLIMDGNYHYQFNLNTSNKYQIDTVIGNIKFKLLELSPYPTAEKVIGQNEYKAKIQVEKQ